MTLSLTHWLTDWLTDGTFTFDIHRATPETCDLFNIWSESLGDMTWPKNTYQPTDQPTFLPIYLPRSTLLRSGKVTNRNDSIDSWVRSQTLLSSWTEFITHSFADTLRHWRLHWCTPGLWRSKQKNSLDSLNSLQISHEFLWEHCETVKTLLMYPLLVGIAGKKKLTK